MARLEEVIATYPSNDPIGIGVLTGDECSTQKKAEQNLSTYLLTGNLFYFFFNIQKKINITL